LQSPALVERAATITHIPETLPMSQTKASAVVSARSGKRARKSDKEDAAYQRRLRAAGMVPGVDPNKDIDAFRNELARRIAMFINAWHGCSRRICRRHRGCMAPDIHCANVRRPTPEQVERDGPRAVAEFHKALEAAVAARRAEEK
jgi:hypothetical protein